MKQLIRIGIVLLLLAGTLIVSACGVPGDDGHTYLALDWTSAPQALSFPEFPQTIYAGVYEEHEAGSYEGEYIAWDGTYWRADYWIEVEAGEEAPLVGTGDHGDDYYLSMWLYSFGPSMYEDDHVVRSISPSAQIGSSAILMGETDALLAARAAAARIDRDGGDVVTISATRTTGPATVHVVARGYKVGE